MCESTGESDFDWVRGQIQKAGTPERLIYLGDLVAMWKEEFSEEQLADLREIYAGKHNELKG